MEEIINIIKSSDAKHIKLAMILKLIVDLCNIDQNKCFILGSYPLRYHRTISDLDMNMDIKEFIKLEKFKSEYAHLEFYNGQIRWFFDLTELYKIYYCSEEKDFSIEIFQKDPLDGYPNEKFSLNYLIENNGLNKDNYGHQYFSLQTLLKWKVIMGREKDKSDVELIKNILEGEFKGID